MGLENFQPGGDFLAGGTGEMEIGELGELRKALVAGYGTDVATLTGGGSLRIQDLDKTLQATVVDNKHFKLFNALRKPKATATVTEWTEQSDIGGFLGSTSNTEDGAADEFQGEYARRTGRVKFMSAYRKVSVVLARQNNIVSAQAIEEVNGAKQILRDTEYLLFEGDEAVVPTEFDGIFAQIASLNSTDHIIDMRGLPLDGIEKIAQAAEVIYGDGNFGVPTDIYTSLSVQTDLNQYLDPAFRVALTGNPQSIQLGAVVKGITTSYGDIATQPDVFVRDEKAQKPFEVKYPAVAVANDVFKPAAASGAAAANVASQFAAGHAGTYYYLVTGKNRKGQSTGRITAQITVAAGDQVTLTIQPSAGGTETGYTIYRSKKNGTNAVADFREIKSIPKAPSGNTTWVDTNEDIPGSTKAYVLNMSASDHAIDWAQYMPMFRMDMAAVNSPIIPWLQMFCGVLRITKRKQHVVIKNIITTKQEWKPFT